MSQSSYKAFIQTKGNRHRLWILVSLGFVSQWVGMGVISYYFAAILRSIGIIDPTQQAGLNGGLQVWNWCLAISGALAVERLGRRPLWLISTGGLLCTFIVVTACSAVYANTESKRAGYIVVAFLFLFSGFFGIAVSLLRYASFTWLLLCSEADFDYVTSIHQWDTRTPSRFFLSDSVPRATLCLRHVSSWHYSSINL